MRYLFLSAALFISGLTAAQTEQGTWTFGSTGSLGFVTGGNTTSFFLRAQPTAGYFLKNKFMLGVGAPIGYGRISETNSFHYGISPFARYYIKGEGKLLFYLQPGSSWVKGPSYVDHQKIYLHLGMNYFLSDNLAIGTELGYGFSKYNGYKSQGFSTGGINLTYFLRSKKE